MLRPCDTSNDLALAFFSHRKARVSSVGRLRDFLAKSDDQSKSDSLDGNPYYNIWHNKAKILSNLKKQGGYLCLKSCVSNFDLARYVIKAL